MAIDEHDYRDLAHQIRGILNGKPQGLVVQALVAHMALVICSAAETREDRLQLIEVIAEDLEALSEVAATFKRDRLDG